MQKVLLVGIGGAIGAMLRYLLIVYCSKFWHTYPPLTILGINISGCFAIGVMLTLISEKCCLDDSIRLTLCIGFLGGYTALSAVAYDVIYMLEHNKFFFGLLYAVGTILFSILACGLGIYLVRHWH